MKKKCTCEGDLKMLVGITLVILFMSLSVLSVVMIINKIKESKYIGQDVVQRSAISVAGIGEILAKPDLATITFSVLTSGDTSEQATEENAEKMNAIIEVVKTQGVDEKDLKTTNFSVYPKYDYLDDEYKREGDREISGYEVTQSLQVKIRDIDNSGEIINVATSAGANQIGGIQFTIDNEEALKSEARELAIKDAKTKAKVLADQLGVKLARIMYFSENSFYPYYDYAMREMAVPMAKGGEVIPDIEIGENKVQVNVSITYEIN